MKWIGGLAQWEEAGTMYLSVAFTWLLDAAYSRALFAKACGLKVVAGGPALFLVKMQHELAGVAEIGQDYPEAILHHNPLACFASRGCPVGCWFCIVPAMEGREFTLIPDFTPRPILCDNNLSALPAEYQDHIIRRYQDAGVTLQDANSGFEPITFTPDVYARWKPLVNAGRGPWRFAYDETKERAQVLQVMRMLAGEPQKRKRVYVLHGPHSGGHRPRLRAPRPAAHEAGGAGSGAVGPVRLDRSEAPRRGALGEWLGLEAGTVRRVRPAPEHGPRRTLRRAAGAVRMNFYRSAISPGSEK
jgi:hypothetical protein